MLESAEAALADAEQKAAAAAAASQSAVLGEGGRPPPDFTAAWREQPCGCDRARDGTFRHLACPRCGGRPEC